MAITLDPKEVRAHLHKLGYCNITPGQLKEFIKDLKKLIKYDQHLLCTCNDSKPSKVCGSSNLDTTRETMRTLNSNSTQSAFESRPTERPKSAHSSVSSKQKCVSYASTNDENSSRSCTSCSVDIPDAEVRSKKYTQFSMPREPQKARSIENLPDHTRPKSSFIKPWNIHSGLQPGMVKKSDPVSLYKYYQDIWKQQKVPGESSHSDLRWCIREQMLGTDPHPRETSCHQERCCDCCLCCSCHHKRRRKIRVTTEIHSLFHKLLPSAAGEVGECEFDMLKIGAIF